jgi:hypothetical protein
LAAVKRQGELIDTPLEQVLVQVQPLAVYAHSLTSVNEHGG